VIAGRIRLLRERLGLTQEKLAARLGVAFPTVNRWENGHTQPSPLALRQIEALVEESNQAANGTTGASLGNRGLE
jgi:transcriptional regulator with XRE-family HTH domain